MKIIFAMLACQKYESRLRACLDTWLRDVKSPNEYILIGDEYVGKKYMNCLTYNDPGYEKLALKMRDFYEDANELNFDFLMKCDDDTYVNVPELITYLETFDPTKPLYLGVDCKNKRFRAPFAQGGAGFVITKPALSQSMNKIRNLFNGNYLEDVVMGQALFESGVRLTNTDRFHHNKVEGRNFLCNTITEHKVMPDEMREHHAKHQKVQ